MRYASLVNALSTARPVAIGRVQRAKQHDAPALRERDRAAERERAQRAQLDDEVEERSLADAAAADERQRDERAAAAVADRVGDGGVQDAFVPSRSARNPFEMMSGSARLSGRPSGSLGTASGRKASGSKPGYMTPKNMNSV